MKVNATDADEPGYANSDIRYSILSQDPPMPNNTFSINPVTGGIMVNSDHLDREVRSCLFCLIRSRCSFELIFSNRHFSHILDNS